MNAYRWISLLALCFTCVSSNDKQHPQNICGQYSEFCKTRRLNAPLGSSVLLPCNFLTSKVNVSWAHVPGVDLVHLTSEGRIKFLDPRYGRVKAFPNQGSVGNYSICIDEFQNSDMGCYRCKKEHECLQVELVAEIGTQRELIPLLIYICICVAALILLSVCSYFSMKCILRCDNRTQASANNPAVANTEGPTTGASAPPEETGRVPVREQQRGADNLVYENDDQDPINQLGDPVRNHGGPPGVLPYPVRTQPTQSTSRIYPNMNQCNSESVEDPRSKQRFHTELFSRLRQASFGRHYYVNQCELSKQQAMATQAENRCRGGGGKKKAKENCEYKNPIYNRSTDQLNRL